jgi:hypothetical protein
MKKTFLTLVASAVMSILLSLPAWAISIDFQPSSQNVNLGDSFDVDLVISDLGNGMAPSLGAFDLDILFDSTKIEFFDYELGSSLGDLILLCHISHGR